MPRSMTGFGSAEGTVAGGRLLIDIRTVNHRHLSVQLKIPSNLQPLEVGLRDQLRQRIDRGHTTVSARWVEEPERETSVLPNVDRARQVFDALVSLKAALGVKGKVGIGLVARHPDVVMSRADDVVAVQWEDVSEIVDRALTEVIEARAREGTALGDELHVRLRGIREELVAVEARAPERIVRERERLQVAVRELTNGHALDETRLAQEIAILADKLDVTEETVRLRAHLDAASACIATAGPVGKQLTFLAQEMLREINTIGSKANDAPIAHAVIRMKGELEKFREQAENVE